MTISDWYGGVGHPPINRYIKHQVYYMNRMELSAPCHFGTEAVLKREIYDLGYDIIKVEDGRVTFEGDPEAICRGNVFLRSTERILVNVGSFHAETFEELFQGIKALPWEDYIPADGKFWVTKATSIKSKLFSTSDIQSIAKKAMVDRLRSEYHITWFEETGNAYPVRIFLMKDEVTVTIDTTGESLHKRGYRIHTAKAPITETLAASLLMLTPWHADRILVDPFCGSGTFPIEAAMMAANIAPGVNRQFLAQGWTNLIDPDLWKEAKEEAKDMEDRTVKTDIQGYDLDGEVVKCARENAKLAGVDHMIHFQQRPVSELRHPKKYGFIITNPPYGERLEEKSDLPPIYGDFCRQFKALEDWSAYMITSYDGVEKQMGRKADKVRKIYNGMMKTTFYQFLGPKPPKKKRAE